MPNSVCFLDPPDIVLNPVEGPSTVEEDEETVSVCSRRLEDADTLLEPSQSGTTCDQNPEIGDLIEIPRGGYSHYALCVGDGDVIHLVRD
ncbi:unnamed protein product [Leuciscus chuanchicus]